MAPKSSYTVMSPSVLWAVACVLLAPLAFSHPCGLVLLFDVTIVLSSSLSILLLWDQNLEGSNKFVKWVGYRVRD